MHVLDPREPYSGSTKVLIWFASAFIVGSVFNIVADIIAIVSPHALALPAAALFVISYSFYFLGMSVLFAYTVHEIRRILPGPIPTWFVLNAAAFGTMTLGTIFLVVGASVLVATRAVLAGIMYTVANTIVLAGISVKMAADQQAISVLYLSSVWKRFSANPTPANAEYWANSFKKEWQGIYTKR
jgi:hypothetical protein